jgi:hypothetical protein
MCESCARAGGEGVRFDAGASLVCPNHEAHTAMIKGIGLDGLVLFELWTIAKGAC